MKESKIEEKLKRTEARLNKAAEEKKALKAKMKQLEEQAESERLVSRGIILESFLKQPLALTNDDVAHLLDLLFRSRFTQRTLSEPFTTPDLHIDKIAKALEGRSHAEITSVCADAIKESILSEQQLTDNIVIQAIEQKHSQIMSA